MKNNISELIVILQQGDSLARRHAAQALGVMGPPAAEAVPALIEVLNDENFTTRGYAELALGRMGSAAVLPLIDALHHQSYRVRRGAVRALAEVGSEAGPAIPHLIEAMASEDWLIRAHAAYALGRARPMTEGVVPALIALLKNDVDYRVRNYSANALAEIGPVNEEIAPALQQALKDKSPDVREVARYALDKIASLMV